MLFREITLENTHNLNAKLYDRFTELVGNDKVRQTHHFAGRFENIYIDAADIPELAPLLAEVIQQAARLLNMAPEQLKAGYWFNAMWPGHVTKPHHHDENDELLSICYYIRVPDESGELILDNGVERIAVMPAEGQLVIFKPDVIHEVTENLSSEMRLSVAFNIGPMDE